MTVPDSVAPRYPTLRRLSVQALADGAAGEPLLDEWGMLQEPLLVIELDGTDQGDLESGEADPDPAVLARAASAAALSRRILVGVAAKRALHPGLQPLVAALDVTVAPVDVRSGPEIVAVADPWAAATALHAAAVSDPQASTVLAGLLRWSGGCRYRRHSMWSPSPTRPCWAGRSSAPGSRPAVRVLCRRLRHPHRCCWSAPPTSCTSPLNRPERRNAYGREVRDALVGALEVALHDAGLHVKLAGAGPSFCSGGDLGEFGTTPDPATAHFIRVHGGAGLLMHQIADRVEVRMHGACVGAGIELPAFAAWIVADPGTTFHLPEIGMGLITGAGGTVSIPRRIGRWRTLYLALSGVRINAAEAFDWGLVDEVRPIGDDVTAP